MKAQTKRRIVESVLGIKIVDPVAVLWKLIDEENEKDEPDCTRIDTWLYSIKRIKEEEGTTNE